MYFTNIILALECYPNWNVKAAHLYLSVYLFNFERERERARVGEGQRKREGDRIPSRLHTVSAEPDAGLEHMNCEIMT